MNRWSKNGVLDRVFEKLQAEQIVRIKIEAFALESTSIKVHPDGTGDLKKRTPVHRQVARRMEHQGSSGCRECSNGHNLRAVSWQRPRCTRRTRPADRAWSDAGGSADADGSRLRGRRDQAAGAQPRHGPHRPSQVQPHRTVGIRSRLYKKRNEIERLFRDSRASAESSLASRSSMSPSSASSPSPSSSKHCVSVNTP